MVKLWVVRSCEVWSWLSAGHDPWHKPTNALFTAAGKLKQDIDHPKISSFCSSICLAVSLCCIELKPYSLPISVEISVHLLLTFEQTQSMLFSCWPAKMFLLVPETHFVLTLLL